MDDNSVEMKKNLVQSLHRLRIDAECEVLEIGDMEMYGVNI
jgi:ERCC4-type nuclease